MEFRPERLRELREEKGYSLGTLARLLKARFGLRISRSGLCQIEKGRYLPGFSLFIAFCRFYEVEPGYFFGADINKQFVSQETDGSEPKK